MEISVTLILTAITGIVSYLSFSNPALKEKLMHHPYSVQHKKEYYRWVTSGFVHRDFMHLLINMFVFYQFAGVVERVFSQEDFFGPVLGKVVFLVFYLLAIVASDIPFYQKNKDNAYKASLGASGGVAAVLFACAMFFPWQMIYLYAIIPIYFIVAAVLYLGYEVYQQKRSGGNSGTNHSAHIYGALFGIIGLFLLKIDMIPTYLHNIISPPFL